MPIVSVRRAHCLLEGYPLAWANNVCQQSRPGQVKVPLSMQASGLPSAASEMDGHWQPVLLPARALKRRTPCLRILL